MTDHNDDCPHCGEDISETIHGLKSALQIERESAKENKRTASKLKDENSKLKAEATDAEIRLKERADATEQVATLQGQLSEAAQKNEALTTDLKATQAEATKLQDAATDGKITAAIAEAGGNVKLLKPMIRMQLDENPVLDLVTTVAAMRNDDEFAGGFKATDQSGGGSEPQKSGDTSFGQERTSQMPTRRNEMTERQKIDYQKQYGLDAFMELPQ